MLLLSQTAGVAKGTFYLYFKDKYDIKDKLIAHKTRELFDNAKIAMEQSQVTGLEEQLIFIIEHITNILANNRPLLNLISKNLVMGALQSALLPAEESESFYESFLNLVKEDPYEYQDVEIMLFTIIELAGSTCYNAILYKEPVPLEQYKPYLYRSVRLIIRSHRVESE